MIIETITKTGGHLASNLGVVELTLALHRAFDSPKDRLVWDTSNQCYTHKLVTGRRDGSPSIRTPGGLSGFAEPTESAARHARGGTRRAPASPTVSGVSMALQGAKDEPYVVVIVGDGALTSGPSYEALNNIVHVKPKRLIVVLNDNGWSISENVGWMVHWRNRFELHPAYGKFIEKGHKFVKRLPKGDKAWELARKLKSSVEGLFLPNLVWDELGLPLRRPGRRAQLRRARGRAGARPGGLGRRHARRHPRPDAQGTRLLAGRGQPLQVPPAGHADGRARLGAALHVLAGLRAHPDQPDGEGREDRRDQRRDARGDRADRGQEALSGPRLRRRHRRGARRHHGGGHGEGRAGARSSRSTRRSSSAPTTS